MLGNSRLLILRKKATKDSPNTFFCFIPKSLKAPVPRNANVNVNHTELLYVSTVVWGFHLPHMFLRNSFLCHNLNDNEIQHIQTKTSARITKGMVIKSTAMNFEPPLLVNIKDEKKRLYYKIAYAERIVCEPNNVDETLPISGGLWEFFPRQG